MSSRVIGIIPSIQKEAHAIQCVTIFSSSASGARERERRGRAGASKRAERRPTFVNKKKGGGRRSRAPPSGEAPRSPAIAAASSSCPRCASPPAACSPGCRARSCSPVDKSVEIPVSDEDEDEDEDEDDEAGKPNAGRETKRAARRRVRSVPQPGIVAITTCHVDSANVGNCEIARQRVPVPSRAQKKNAKRKFQTLRQPREHRFVNIG